MKFTAQRPLSGNLIIIAADVQSSAEKRFDKSSSKNSEFFGDSTKIVVLRKWGQLRGKSCCCWSIKMTVIIAV